MSTFRAGAKVKLYKYEGFDDLILHSGQEAEVLYDEDDQVRIMWADGEESFTSEENLFEVRKGVLNWFTGGKSKYKKKEEYKWWEDEPEAKDIPTTTDYDDGYTRDYDGYGGYGGYGGGWGSYGGYNEGWYKPKFDMSVNLENRVKQLIRAITGKSLKLVRSYGWGSDDKYFYYNAEDLKDATDDEILGRIFHQLAKELYVDKENVVKINKADPAYRHLLNTLEDNRADHLLQERYPGAGYYAKEIWDTRKFQDNPLNFYLPVIRTLDDLNKDQHGRSLMFDAKRYRADKQYRESINNWIATENTRRANLQNPSWEFCFNINAVQNGETEYDFSQDQVHSNFEKAIPFIKQYLEAKDLAEALKIYPDIKKYYPKPNKSQEEQMDREMAQTEGLTTEQMAAERARAEQMAAQMAKHGTAKDMEEMFSRRGGLEKGDLELTTNLAEYKRIKAINMPVIANLHYLIRSIIKDNAIRRYQRPFKRGKIDAKSMYKYLATDNLRIFKKQRVISEKKYTMAILVDKSGSMQGQNADYALGGTIVLSEVFEMLGLPYEIMGFDGTAYLFKKFEGGLKREYIPSLKHANGGTDDVNALETMRTRIKNFDPSNTFHKGIFVLSDGMGSDPDKMKELVTEIEKTHNATVFGIGIGDMDEEDLARAYNHYLRVNDIRDLPRNLVDLMKTQFKRG